MRAYADYGADASHACARGGRSCRSHSMVFAFLSDEERLKQNTVLCASALLLKSLAQHSDPAKESLLGDDADEVLLTLLRSHAEHAKVLEACMDLLLSIMFRDETTSEKLVANGLITVVIGAMSTHPGTPSTHFCMPLSPPNCSRLCGRAKITISKQLHDAPRTVSC